MKNKEIEELLQTLDGIASGDWIQMLPKEANLLLSYIEQLENNRDKAIEYLEEKYERPISYYCCIKETLKILKGDSE